MKKFSKYFFQIKFNSVKKSYISQAKWDLFQVYKADLVLEKSINIISHIKKKII